MIDGDGDGGGVQIVKMSECLSFGFIGGEIYWVGEVSIECLDISLLELRMLLLKDINRLGSVEAGSLLFRDLMVFQQVLVMFIVPWRIFPDLLFVFCDVCVYFLVEFGYEGVVGFSELGPIVDFG